MKTLIIEPDTSMADLLVTCLKQKKCEITLTQTDRSGIAYARSGKFDLIILDAVFPSVSGYEIVRTLRDNHLITPILMITPQLSVDDRIHGLRCGIDYCLTRDFDIRELDAFLDILMRRQLEADEQLSYGNTILNLSAGSLICGSTELHLSEKEFHLCRLLFQFGDSTLSKETILSRVWGCDSYAIDNNVEVYIRFLRKKLLQIQSNVRISTIRRMGYHLELLPDLT